MATGGKQGDGEPRESVIDAAAPEQPTAAVEQPAVEELLALYQQHFGSYKIWLSHIREILESAPEPTRRKIHSIRTRLKDSDHLREKIARKRGEGRIITRDNLFEEIRDLAGVRVITLYRWDFAEIHALITEHGAAWWEVVGKSEAYCAYQDDAERFREIGLEPKVRADKPYTSIHYSVSPRGKRSPACEIQVRGLHLEGWGEVDHELRYPSRSPGELAEDVLVALHQAAAVTDWLAHVARRADEMHQRLESERREKEELLTKLQSLSSQLDQAGAAKNQADALVKQLRAQLAAAAPYQGVTSTTFSVPTTQGWLGLGREKCQVCGRDSSSSFLPTLKRCGLCQRLFCIVCAGNSRSGFFSGASFASSLGDMARETKNARCKECSDRDL